MMSEWLTPRQVAARLNVAVGTLANWRCQGIGPRYVKLTGSPNSPVRYKSAEVEAYMGEQEAAA